MKEKTINSIISKKINHWISSIKDEVLQKKVRNNIVVTGGCITSLLQNETPNDYDVYFTDKDTVLEIAKYYTNIWNESKGFQKNRLGKSATAWVLDGEDVERWKDGKIKLSSFALDYKDITYSSDMEWNSSSLNRGTNIGPSGMLLNTSSDRVKIIINSDGIGLDENEDEIADTVEYNIDDYIETISTVEDLSTEEKELEEADKEIEEMYRPVFLSTNAITLSNKIQLIIRFYGSPEEIHSNYDFVHCTNYWESKTGKVVLNNRALMAIMNKELFYVGSKYPIASVIRTRKFLKRGWQINAGQYLKMAMQINELNLKDIYVLEDQLVGIDSIYFIHFIRSVIKDIESGKEINIDSTYLAEVIDRIFG